LKRRGDSCYNEVLSAIISLQSYMLRSYGIQSTVLEISKSFVAFTLRRKEVIMANTWSGAYLLI